MKSHSDIAFVVPKTTLLQGVLGLCAVLSTLETVILPTDPRSIFIEASLCLVAIALSIRLFFINLRRYAFFFVIVAFCYNPISKFYLTDYAWIRPHGFIVLISLFLIFLLRNRLVLTHLKMKKGKAYG